MHAVVCDSLSVRDCSYLAGLLQGQGYDVWLHCGGLLQPTAMHYSITTALQIVENATASECYVASWTMKAKA